MRAVIQRVRSASVEIGGEVAAGIGPGMLILIGFSADDAAKPPRMEAFSRRAASLRIFDDAEGRLNRSIADVDGEILVVPQVTLAASLAKGHRPSFHTAAPPEAGRILFAGFLEALKASWRGEKVQAGIFQADMRVRLENDGPVTFILDSEAD